MQAVGKQGMKKHEEEEVRDGMGWALSRFLLPPFYRFKVGKSKLKEVCQRNGRTYEMKLLFIRSSKFKNMR
jgi:hypothetical protein